MNVFSDAQRRAIAARATPLEGRIENDYTGASDELPAGARRALERWRDTEDGESILQWHLADGNATSDDPRAYLSLERLDAEESLPDWVSELERLLASVTDELRTDRTPDPDLPFEEVHDAIAACVWNRVSLPASSPVSTLYRGFRAWWRERLSLCLSRALLVEYRLFQRQVTESYTAFLDHLASGGLAEFFVSYPVAGRFVHSLVTGFETSVERFATDLVDDYDQLGELLPGGEPGTVTAVRPGQGDPHGTGQTVVEVTFDGDRELIYKPRSVGPERRFSETLHALNADGVFSYPHDPPDVLDRGDHGWVEYVEGAATSRAAAPKYYHRTGNLVGLLFLLSATDCHYENLIADGEQPTLVDCETVATHTKPPKYASDRHAEVDVLNHHVYSSTLGTLMLPFNAVLDRTDSPDKHVYGDDSPDLSGIGATSPSESTHAAPRWRALGTPEMDVEYEYGTTDPAESVPSDGDDIHYPSEYVESVVDGFEEVYDHFRRSADGTVASLWDGVEPRFMARPTSLYVSLSYDVTEPTALRNAAVVDARLDALASGWVDRADWAVDDYWPVVLEERRALWRLDVPRLHVEGRSLVSEGGRRIESHFETLPEDGVVSSRTELSVAERRREADRIRASLDAKAAATGGDDGDV